MVLKYKIGGLYRADQDFILFDVIINGNYQPRESVKDIANYFNIQSVPIVFEGILQEGIDYVKNKPTSLLSDKALMEGLVARPKQELQTRTGDRVIVKIKVKDFDLSSKELEKENDNHIPHID